jgi:hypothetical protein
MPAGDQPDKAAEVQLLRRTGNPQGELPLERYEAARQKLTRMPAYNLAAAAPAAKGTRKADLGGWESLGPANQGGRTRVLLIHPQDPKIMYAAAVTGGVWKTTDAGENWAPLTDLFPTLGLGALAMDPANPDILYAGTGFWFNTLSGTNVFGSAPLGTGIFRTRDAGQSWEPLGNPGGANFRYINDIFVSRSDSNRIYAATPTGVFRSTDSGASWTQIFNRGTNGRNGCQDMVMRTDQSTDYFYAACGTTTAGDAAIFRNTDAASDAPWEKVLQLPAMGNTTLCVVATDARIDKTGCTHLARQAHAGLARAIAPYGTALDGDIAFAVSTGDVGVNPVVLGNAVAEMAAAAARDAVRSATSVRGVPTAAERRAG